MDIGTYGYLYISRCFLLIYNDIRYKTKGMPIFMSKDKRLFKKISLIKWINNLEHVLQLERYQVWSQPVPEIDPSFLTPGIKHFHLCFLNMEC